MVSIMGKLLGYPKQLLLAINKERTSIWDNVELVDPSTHIRLLRLEPRKNRYSTEDYSEHEIIAGSLSVWPLAEPPPFTALSYTWGSPEPRREVLINGRRVSVNENCRYALWQARLHDPGQYVWIDTVCINQEDLEEKSAQVAMMFEIFGAATEVCACVGPHAHDSRDLCGAVEDLQELCDNSNPSDSGYNICSAWLLGLESAQATAIATAFPAFDERRYWKRLWIVQELCAAKDEDIKILCGQHALEWSTLQVVARLLIRDGPGRSHVPGVMAILWFKDECRDGFYLLSDFLFRIQYFQCHDPRDRVYGVIKLIDWPHGISPPVDYRKTVVEVAEDLMACFARESDVYRPKIEQVYGALGLLPPSYS